MNGGGGGKLRQGELKIAASKLAQKCHDTLINLGSVASFKNSV